jgi:hypothetical protein
MWDLWWTKWSGAGFLRVLRFPLPIFIPSISPQSPSSIICGCYNRPVVAAVPSGLSPTPLIIIIIIIIIIGQDHLATLKRDGAYTQATLQTHMPIYNFLLHFLECRPEHSKINKIDV